MFTSQTSARIDSAIGSWHFARWSGAIWSPALEGIETDLGIPRMLQVVSLNEDLSAERILPHVVIWRE